MRKAIYDFPYLHIEHNGIIESYELNSKKVLNMWYEKYKLLVDSALANWGQVVSDKTMLPEWEKELEVVY